MAKFDETEGRWITTKSGRHIFIRKENKWSDLGAYERDYDERDVAHYKNFFGGDSDTKEVPMHRHDLISQYREDIREYLKSNKLPIDITFGESNIQKDAFLSALDKEYELSDIESKMLDSFKTTTYINGTPHIQLGDNKPVSIFGLTDSGVNGLKKMLVAKETKKGNDLVDKQEKEIAERAKQTKELNDEKKANDLASKNRERQQKLVDKYRKELKSYLKDNNGKLPRRLNMGTTTVQRDAVLSALDSEYNLSSAEEKIWDKIQFINKGGVQSIWLPGKAPIETTGLSPKAISGLRKWLSVWGAEHLDT